MKILLFVFLLIVVFFGTSIFYSYSLFHTELSKTDFIHNNYYIHPEQQILYSLDQTNLELEIKMLHELNNLRKNYANMRIINKHMENLYSSDKINLIRSFFEELWAYNKSYSYDEYDSYDKYEWIPHKLDTHEWSNMLDYHTTIQYRWQHQNVTIENFSHKSSYNNYTYGIFNFDKAYQKLSELEILNGSYDTHDIHTIEVHGHEMNQCNICKTRDFTHKRIFHPISCKHSPYKQYDNAHIGFVTSPDIIKQISTEKFVKFNELTELTNSTNSNESNVTIYGSNFAESSVIVTLRDPNTTKTVMVHITKLKNDSIDKLFEFFNDSLQVDVYLSGGNLIDISLPKNILEAIHKKPNHNIVFCHLIDYAYNSFAINPINGDIYVNMLF